MGKWICASGIILLLLMAGCVSPPSSRPTKVTYSVTVEDAQLLGSVRGATGYCMNKGYISKEESLRYFQAHRAFMSGGSYPFRGTDRVSGDRAVKQFLEQEEAGELEVVADACRELKQFLPEIVSIILKERLYRQDQALAAQSIRAQQQRFERSQQVAESLGQLEAMSRSFYQQSQQMLNNIPSPANAPPALTIPSQGREHFLLQTPRGTQQCIKLSSGYVQCR